MNQAEFESKVTAMTEDMYRVAATMLRAHADRQDAVQEGIWKAWRQLEKLRDASAFRPWMMRILVNECHSLLRRRKWEVVAEQIEAGAEEKNWDQRLRDEMLHEAIGKLPERIRLVIVLYYMDGFTMQEVAWILHIPEGTVKSRLNTGRKRLKELLGKEV